MADEDRHKMAFQPNFVMLKHAAVKKPHYTATIITIKLDILSVKALILVFFSAAEILALEEFKFQKFLCHIIYSQSINSAVLRFSNILRIFFIIKNFHI